MMINTILLLEDEEALGRVYQKKLKREGFDIHWVQTADEVKDIINKYQFDIVFLDHAISDFHTSGMDLIPIVKEKQPHSKIYMLSNFSEFTLEDDAKKAGANGYFVKIDTSPTVLTKKLREMEAAEA